MKRRLTIGGLWLLVLAAAVMIFLFSAQSGEESTRTSDGITYRVLRFLYPGFDGLDVREQAELYETFNYLVRKAAHFGEFALLGLPLRLLFHALRLRRPQLWAWIAGTLYAGTDELHQLISGTRTAMWQDVALDSAGVLFGALAALLALRLRARKKASST